jgi:hypothetical protein
MMLVDLAAFRAEVESLTAPAAKADTQTAHA